MSTRPSAGRDVLWLTDRTGHTSLSMLRRYDLGEGAPVAADVAITRAVARLARELEARG